jgi:hypothetical protein
MILHKENRKKNKADASHKETSAFSAIILFEFLSMFTQHSTVQQVPPCLSAAGNQ